MIDNVKSTIAAAEKREPMKKFVQKLLRTGLSCLLAVSITLSCFYGGNAVYVGIQARKAERKREELHQLYHHGQEDPPEDDEWEEAWVDPQMAFLRDINRDLVGWLELGGESGFAAPVVQRDNSYYLKHDFYGRDDRHGAVFLDYRNQIEPNDDNLILYGHNMNDGAWFHYLVNYQDPDFVRQNPIITFDTLHEEGRYVVFGVFVAATLPQHGDDFDYHNKVSFQTVEDKQDYLDRVSRRSLLDTGVESTIRDELLTLSTCLYDFSGERLVVVARRLREGESEGDFAALQVSRRADPEMPAIWQQLYGSAR